MLDIVNYYHKEFHFRCYRGSASIVIFLRRSSHSQCKRPIRSTLNIEKAGYLHLFDIRKLEKARHLFQKVGGTVGGKQIINVGFLLNFEAMSYGIPEKLASGRMVWTLGLCTPGRLDSGQLDSGRLNAWTLDAWTLG